MNSYLNHIKYESLYESYAPCFSSENLTAVLIKLTHTIREFFTKLRLIFHKFSLIINTVLPPLRETLYAARVKLSGDGCSSSSTLLQLFTHAVAARRSPQNGFREAHPSDGQKKMEVGEC
jgi:hypothetical protein